MKQIRFSDLPTSSQVNEADVFPIIQNGDNKKAQQSSIKDYSQYKNIPKVNGRALSGNVTLDELGAQAPGEYLTEKELLDADLVTKVENANKADKNYGAENSGKYLGTDENGEIAPINVKFSDDNKIIKMAQGNPTIVNDSYEGKLKKLNIYGESHQVSTTGAQLLNLPTGTFTNEQGQSLKVNDDMTVDVTSPVYESGYHDVIINLETPIDVVEGQTNLRLFFDGNISSFASFFLADDNGNVILSINLGTSYTGVATKTSQATKFYYRQKQTGGINSKGLKLMVSQSSITDYEPYTGGKPSPSPDYPQEIISKEVSEIKVTGANLCESASILEESMHFASVLYCEMDLKKNVTYYFSFVGAKGNALYNNEYIFSKFISFTCTGEREIIAMTVTEDLSKDNATQYVNGRGWIIFKNTNSNTVVPDFKNIQVSLINEIEYEPYKEQKITLPEPITLYGLPIDKSQTTESDGNVIIDGQQYISDVIKEKDGVIGVERNVESFSLLIKDMNNNDSYPGWKSLDVVDKILPPQANDTQISTCLCTIQSRVVYARRDFGILYFTADNLGKNQTELKEQYPDLSVDFVAISYEPTFEPLPEEIQAQYKALKSYYPNTVIQTGCWNETEYEVSLQSFVEDMYEKIKEVNNNNNKLLL